MIDDNIIVGNRVCSICKIEKDNSHFCFYKNRFTKDGYRLRVNTNCRECSDKLRKETAILKKIHIHSKPQPNSFCPCCGKPSLKFEMDHDHKTGEFRGWICKDCNVGMGKLGDSVDGLLKAIQYLEKIKSSVSVNN